MSLYIGNHINRLYRLLKAFQISGIIFLYPFNRVNIKYMMLRGHQHVQHYD